MIRRAVITDLNEIMNIVRETVIEMNSYNNYQWNENYPTREQFLKDIENESLFVCEKDGILTGFVCINKEQPKEYGNLNWKFNSEAYVVHRLAVSSKCRKEGFAYKLMKFAQELAVKNKSYYLKTDTCSSNKKAQGLFEKCGYNFVGKVKFCGEEETYYCYEKTLVD